MSAKIELIEACKTQLEKIGVSSVNEESLENIIEAFGPSAYNEDAQLIAFSDEEEVERFMNSNVNEKLGLTVDTKAVEYLKESFSGINQRLRVVAYYLLLNR
jgi:mevalonate kinase